MGCAPQEAIMSQRALSTALVAAGFVLALVLIIVGADLVAASQRGPRWKRRMLGAGLVLLAALGMTPATTARAAAATPATVPAQPASAQEALAGDPLWKRILAAWQEAEAVASGKRGDYPFDEKGKASLLASLETTDADLKLLRDKNLLTEPEAALLREDLTALAGGVEAKRPTELRNATCYEPVAIPIPVAQSAGRLAARLPLLKSLATGATIHPEAARVALATLEADVKLLDEPGALDKIKIPESRVQARQSRDAARSALDGIRLRLAPEVALEETPQWKNLLALARDVDAAKRVGKPATVDAAQWLQDRAQNGTFDVGALIQAKLLTENEGAFLLTWCREMEIATVQIGTDAQAAVAPPALVM
jgi:hypothetical protein